MNGAPDDEWSPFDEWSALMSGAPSMSGAPDDEWSVFNEWSAFDEWTHLPTHLPTSSDEYFVHKQSNKSRGLQTKHNIKLEILF